MKCTTCEEYDEKELEVLEIITQQLLHQTILWTRKLKTEISMNQGTSYLDRIVLIAR